ncbi:MAG: hypothetical protein GC149_15650 [Gammaproteobacteria bacterium]|nr:hypothetical protein [Gammaproteobacteria bacterium]
MKKTIITTNIILLLASAFAVWIALYYGDATANVSRMINEDAEMVESRGLICNVDECRGLIKEELKFIRANLKAHVKTVHVLKIVSVVAAIGFLLNFLLAFTIKRRVA